MKIIQIMDSLTLTGGVGTFVFDLCVALKKAGQDVYVVGIIGDKTQEAELTQDYREARIPVTCLWRRSKPDAILHGIPELRRTVQNISQGEPTICNLHLKLSVLLGALAAGTLSNVKCVETYHSQYRNYWPQRFCLSPLIKKYICCSKPAYEEFKRRFYTKDTKLFCIPNGIDAEDLKKSIAGMPKTEKKSIEFLTVARFEAEKNLHITASAFAPLSAEKVRYKLIGKGPLKAQVVSAGKESKTVEFLGTMPRNEVMYNLSCADMAVMPSLWEGLSIFHLEALAFGVPLMLSDIESFRAVMKEPPLNPGEKWRRCSWGYLCSVSDEEAYRSAALDYVENISRLKPEMSKVVQELAGEYSIANTAKKYIDVYNSLT